MTESAKMAISPLQRALAEGPLMPNSSREMPEGLPDASPTYRGTRRQVPTVYRQQNEGRRA
jgi:hypothetical protein